MSEEIAGVYKVIRAQARPPVCSPSGSIEEPGAELHLKFVRGLNSFEEAISQASQ